jgi:hypothetical protein
MLSDLVEREGLFTSLIDDAQISREERCLKLLQWLSPLTHRVDGLARLAARALGAAHPLSWLQVNLSEGTRWVTPYVQMVRAEGEGLGLGQGQDMVLRSEDARVPLSRATRLTLLLAADFFLLKHHRAELHGLYLNLLIDADFKPALAKVRARGRTSRPHALLGGPTERHYHPPMRCTSRSSITVT